MNFSHPKPLFISISLISASALGYEILLMRLFSIIHWHHFAYMIISLALLGYGASGTFLVFARQKLKKHFAAAYITNAVLHAISLLGCFLLAQKVPFNSLEVAWDAHQQFYLLILYIILSVPFFCAANCIGLAFIKHKDQINLIYRSDLIGAGIGALIIILLLFIVHPRDCLPLLFFLAMLSAVFAILDQDLNAPRWVAGLCLFCGIALPVLIPKNWIELEMSEYKGLSRTLQVMGTKVLSEHSSPLGLLTVVASSTVPFRHAPGLSLKNTVEPPPQLGVFIDGDALNVITRFTGDRKPLAYLDGLTSALPYHLLKNPKTLILGSGGGADMLQAYYHKAETIDAVELNPQFVDLVQQKYYSFAGNLYNLQNVNAEIAEARGYIAGKKKQFDLIQIALLDSFAASSAGVQSLSESYLYTVEALKEYLNRLSPEGIVAITRWLKLPPRESLKLFTTAIKALEESGVSDPKNRLALIRNWKTTTLLIKNTGLTEDDIDAIRNFSNARAFDIAYYPSMPAQEANRYNILREPYLYQGMMALTGKGREDFVKRYKFNIEPSTDNKPYFFHFFKWRALPELLAMRNQGGLFLVEWGYLILVATLLQAAVISFVLILLPLWVLQRDKQIKDDKKKIGFYFAALGLAFLFIEIAFIQKFILFLSHPLYAIAVVLCGFLVFAGLGSGYSDYFSRQCRKISRSPITLSVAGITTFALLYLFLLPPLFHRLISLPDIGKILVSILLIAPLAFFMGMPFPLGLLYVASKSSDFIPWAWGINGCASVISAVLASVLAIHFGFTAVVILALLLYIFAAFALQHKAARRRNQKSLP